MTLQTVAQTSGIQSWLQKNQGALEVASGGLLISFSAVFVRLTDTGPAVDGFYRMLFGGLSLLILALLRGDSFRIPSDHMRYIFLCGICLCSDLFCWHQSIDYIGPGLATILGNMQVFLLAFVGICFYHEKVDWKYLLALPIAALGMYLLVGVNWDQVAPDYKTGVYLGLSTAFFYMLAVVFLRKMQSDKDHLEAIPNLALISFVGVGYFIVVGYLHHESFIIPDSRNFMWLFCYGLFGQAIGWLLITRGVAKISMSLAGFLILLQPAGSFVWDILFFHRPTPAIQVLGAIITLGSIYLSTTGHIKKPD